MKRALLPFVLVFAGALCLTAGPASALVLDQIDDFEDGTTQNWVVALLGEEHPAPPENIPTGGPTGMDDNYLLVTAQGGQGPGSRLTVNNITQWAGDYPNSGVALIEMDLRNFSNEDLYIRLLFEDPTAGPPQNVAVTSVSVELPAGSDWIHASFSISPGDLTALEGDINTALANTTVFRIFHNEEPAFPPPPVVARLGLDNIQALSGPTPTDAASWGRIKSLFR